MEIDEHYISLAKHWALVTEKEEMKRTCCCRAASCFALKITKDVVVSPTAGWFPHQSSWDGIAK